MPEGQEVKLRGYCRVSDKSLEVPDSGGDSTAAVLKRPPKRCILDLGEPNLASVSGRFEVLHLGVGL